MLLSEEEIAIIIDNPDVIEEDIAIAKAQLKKVVERLADALENHFVMALADNEGLVYEPTIDPTRLRELIQEMRQTLLKKTK